MERRMKKVILQQGSILKLPRSALNTLNVKEGDELIIIYTKEMIVLMSPEKFGEIILDKK